MRAHELDEGKVVNILKGAIATSDRVLTFRNTRTKLPLPRRKGLEGLLAAIAPISGVANGIDLEEWNPSDDKDCAAPYSILDFSGKLECKRALQREMGLPKETTSRSSVHRSIGLAKRSGSHSRRVRGVDE